MNINKTNFKVCTLNLFNYVAPPNAFYELENIYSSSQWQKKECWIQQQLSILKPDIIGFQEVFSPKALQQLTLKQGFPYFATVSEPRISSHHVYDKPVVALASKFPIVSLSAVEVIPSVLGDLKIHADFNFSRPPIKAEIKIDGFSNVLVYVVHLKSQRSLLESSLNETENVLNDISSSMAAQVHGRWASTIQRGTEAALIYQDIIQEMHHSQRPVILMGDLNDAIESHAIQPLLGGANMDKVNNKYISNMPLSHQRAIQRFSLYDAFLLQDKIIPSARKATHYFANRGNVLDYILLSKDFNINYDHSLASITNYHVSDKHLVNPKYEVDAECSDHAPVMVEIEIRC